jgi:hypothetical protein
MLADWPSAIAKFRQVVPVARLQAQAEQPAAAAQESAPKTAA